MTLKQALRQINCPQASLARHLALSPATISQIVNKGLWPISLDRAEIERGIEGFLVGNGFPAHHARRALQDPPGTCGNTPGRDDLPDLTQEYPMLLKKCGLAPAARKHFNLFRDPFADDLASHEDVFATPDIRYVREAMWNKARHGGFLAVVGESGAGKSTLRLDLIDRIVRDDAPIIVIEPYVLGMEENDKKGHTLKAAGIADSIIGRLAPLTSPRHTMEAKSSQVHNLLRESHKAGYVHCLIIEEAHCLPVPTLKHLKRFYEIADGFTRYLSIILIGQPELRTRLDERNPQVREVTQRCEIVTLNPLDRDLEAYLAFKFQRAGGTPAQVFTPDALDALSERLTFNRAPSRGERREAISLLYPLAVNNLIACAMNLAAEIGAPAVNAAIVKEV